MMKVQTKIYRYGASQVQSALASDAADPVPRKGPTPTTSRTVPRGEEPGSRKKLLKLLLAKKKKTVQNMFQDLADREMSSPNNEQLKTH